MLDNLIERAFERRVACSCASPFSKPARPSGKKGLHPEPHNKKASKARPHWRRMRGQRQRKTFHSKIAHLRFRRQSCGCFPQTHSRAAPGKANSAGLPRLGINACRLPQGPSHPRLYRSNETITLGPSQSAKAIMRENSGTFRRRGTMNECEPCSGVFAEPTLADLTQYRRDLHQIPEVDFDLPSNHRVRAFDYRQATMRSVRAVRFHGMRVVRSRKRARNRHSHRYGRATMTEKSGVPFCSLTHDGQMHARRPRWTHVHGARPRAPYRRASRRT